MIKNEAKKNLKYKDITTDIQRTWNVKTKVITSNNWGYWNHLLLLQKISEQHAGKHKIQGLKKQPYYTLCTCYAKY